MIGTRTARSVSARRPGVGVRPSRARAQFSSIRSAPPASAAAASSTLSTHTSNNTRRTMDSCYPRRKACPRPQSSLTHRMGAYILGCFAPSCQDRMSTGVVVVARRIGVIALGSALVAAGFLAGCQPQQPPPTPPPATRARVPAMLAAGRDDAVARLPGLTISRDQFLAPLIEGHGLPVLLNVVQLELARQNAQRMGVKLTDADLAEERKRTLSQAFGELEAKIQQQI